MAMKTVKTVTDSTLRNTVFEMMNVANIDGFKRINDRQWGILLTDVNGTERYVRVGAIVAEEREDMTARELMAMEVADYEQKQAKKAAQAAERAEKAARDKAAREAKKKEKEGE